MIKLSSDPHSLSGEFIMTFPGFENRNEPTILPGYACCQKSMVTGPSTIQLFLRSSLVYAVGFDRVKLGHSGIQTSSMMVEHYPVHHL